MVPNFKALYSLLSELQRFLSRLFHKRAITIDGNRQCTWHNSTLCNSPLPTAPALLWLAISESSEPIFNFLSALLQSRPNLFCAVYWNVFLMPFGRIFAFCLVCARLGLQHHSSTVVLVTGLGHCLLPFPVRGAAYANIFNMIAFLYFDFMRSLYCVGRVWGVGAWPAHITNIIEKIVFIKYHNLCNEITD